MRGIGALVLGSVLAGCNPGCDLRVQTPYIPLSLVPMPNFQDGETLRRALERRNWNRAIRYVVRIRDSEDHFPLVTSVPPDDEDPTLPYHGNVVDGPRYLIHLLSSGPPEFLQVYRDTFDPEAARAVKRGLTPLDWERYFFCTDMDFKGDRLALQLHDRGHSLEAFEIWKALQVYRRDLRIPLAVLSARMMVAAATAGERSLLDEVPAFHGEFLAGSDRGDLEDLRRQLADGFSPSKLTSGKVGHSDDTPSRLETRIDDSTPLELVLHDHQEEFIIARNLAYELCGLPDTRITSMSVGTDLAWVSRNNRLLWITDDYFAGLVQIDPPRTLWMGKISDAPTPSRWRGECLKLMGLALRPVRDWLVDISWGWMHVDPHLKLYLR